MTSGLSRWSEIQEKWSTAITVNEDMGIIRCAKQSAKTRLCFHARQVHRYMSDAY